MGLYIVADVGKGPIAAEISEVDLDFGPRMCAMIRLISRKHGRHFVVRSAGPEIVDVKAAPHDWAGDRIAYVDRSALSVAVQECRKRIGFYRIDQYLDLSEPSAFRTSSRSTPDGTACARCSGAPRPPA